MTGNSKHKTTRIVFLESHVKNASLPKEYDRFDTNSNILQSTNQSNRSASSTNKSAPIPMNMFTRSSAILHSTD